MNSFSKMFALASVAVLAGASLSMANVTDRIERGRREIKGWPGYENVNHAANTARSYRYSYRPNYVIVPSGVATTPARTSYSSAFQAPADGEAQATEATAAPAPQMIMVVPAVNNSRGLDSMPRGFRSDSFKQTYRSSR